MNQPSAQIAINILSGLKNQTSPAALAYWVTPNTVLTLSGARAYCDGVFYHDDKKILDGWTKEMNDSIKVIESITSVYFAEAKVDKSTSSKSYAGYDLILSHGLKYVLGQTALLGPGRQELLTQNLRGKKLVEALSALLKDNEQLKHFNKDNLNHVAFGILVGYPDKAILGSVLEWEKDDPFNEPLIDADIRGSRYYTCPVPIYSYPRHMVTDPDINAHEQLWSTILKDYYLSAFHKQLEADKSFQQKLNQLELLR